MARFGIGLPHRATGIARSRINARRDKGLQHRGDAELVVWAGMAPTLSKATSAALRTCCHLAETQASSYALQNYCAFVQALPNDRGIAITEFVRAQPRQDQLSDDRQWRHPSCTLTLPRAPASWRQSSIDCATSSMRSCQDGRIPRCTKCLRKQGCRLAKAEFVSLRERLKIAASVIEHGARIRVPLPTRCSERALFPCRCAQ